MEFEKFKKEMAKQASPPTKPTNQLYYGDNLGVMREHIPAESVDLVYLDPPFNSNATYNVLFAEKSGDKSASQIKAFEDTWEYTIETEAFLMELLEHGGPLAELMKALRVFLGRSDMMAYLVMMAIRLVEIRRIMRDTATIWLHCDPKASHYLKLILDSIFGPKNFRNEVIWKRTMSKGLMKRQLPNNHDIVLAYQKTPEAKWNINEAFEPYDLNNLDEKTKKKYSQKDKDGRLYQLTSLINPNPDRANLTYKFLGFTKVWRWEEPRMLKAYKAGEVVQVKPGSIPRYVRYLDKQRGKPFGDVWSDIPPLNSQAQERLGYPTQKPEALLERIIKMTTDKDSVVFDPFCGCGTSVAAAQRLARRWVGIDITALAITLIRHRLASSHGADVSNTYTVLGEPASFPDAESLAKADPYQFQVWALGLVGARPKQLKKGKDQGIDGKLFFNDGKISEIIFSVKAGKVQPAFIRDLHGVVTRDKAAIGALICLHAPTKEMVKAAAAGGFYNSPWGKYPKIQILTIEDLLTGKKLDFPGKTQTNVTFKKAPKAKGLGPKAVKMSFEEDADEEIDDLPDDDDDDFEDDEELD